MHYFQSKWPTLFTLFTTNTDLLYRKISFFGHKKRKQTSLRVSDWLPSSSCDAKHPVSRRHGPSTFRLAIVTLRCSVAMPSNVEIKAKVQDFEQFKALAESVSGKQGSFQRFSMSCF